MTETCSLDVADQGEHIFEEVAAMLGIHKQAVEQMLSRGLISRLQIALQDHEDHCEDPEISPGLRILR
jgi:hypothetical protein